MTSKFDTRAAELTDKHGSSKLFYYYFTINSYINVLYYLNSHKRSWKLTSAQDYDLKFTLKHQHIK